MSEVKLTPSKAVEAGRIMEAMGQTCIQAAHELGMGKTAYQEAKRVVEAAEKDPAFNDLVERMDRTGKIGPSYRELRERQGGIQRRPREHVVAGRRDKTAPYKPETPGQIQKAEGQKKKLILALSTLNGHCRGLKELDIPMALSVCNEEEIKTWQSMAKEIAKTLRELNKRLKP
jgi:hypothetical protein